MFKKISAVIYDMDGLLLDTERLYSQAANSVINPYGKSITNELKSRMIGRPAIESAKLLVEELQIPLSPEEYIQKRDQVLKQFVPTALPMPGAKELTHHLHSKGIKQAVATSSKKVFFESKTVSHQEWFSLFDSVICGDNPSVTNGKPAPDIFLVAAKSIDANPEECLVFEDAPAGVQGAKSANMSAVAVLEEYANPDFYQQADQILKSLHEFDPTQWGLPAF